MSANKQVNLLMEKEASHLSLSKKKTTLSKISSKDIEKFNDTLSDDGHCDIKEYKERFLKYFDIHLKEYYEDFEGYFSDSDSDSSSSEESDKKYQTGLKRETSDAFYTNGNIAKKCVEELSNIVDFKEYDIIMEPSAGAGVFSDMFLEYDDLTVLSYDINPKQEYIKKQDFLKLKTYFLKEKRVLTVGNPPFGRQSSLAKKFIKKCATFSEVIAFILPRSFKKESMHNQFPLSFHKIFEKNIPKNAFTIGEKSYDVPCIFQVWKKKDFERKKPIKYDPVNYKFVKKEDTPDVSLRRVGVYAGNISKEIKNKSAQSHYFIKLDTIEVDDFIKKFKKIKFKTDNTVGPKSISKNEFTKEINTFMK